MIIYSGFKVIEAEICFTEISHCFSDILWSPYRRPFQCSQIWHVCWRVCSPTVTNDWFPVIFESLRVPHVGAGNDHTFWNTWFQSLWAVNDFTYNNLVIPTVHLRVCVCVSEKLFMDHIAHWIMVSTVSWNEEVADKICCLDLFLTCTLYQ